METNDSILAEFTAKPDPKPIELVHAKPGVRDPVAGLHHTHRRVAMLRAADMSIQDISRWMECTEETVCNILRIPRVQRLMLKLGAATSDDLRPKVEEVNDLVVDTLREAFETEIALMRRTFQRTEDVESERLCFSITKDVLDRGGTAAPKRLETKSMSLNLGAENVQAIANTLRELDAI